MQLLERER